MSSKQIKDLIDLIKKTKDKKEQAKLKKILKELLSKTKNYKLRSTVRKPKLELQTGIKEQVEKLINPVLDEFKTDKIVYEDLADEQDNIIEELKNDLVDSSPQEQIEIQAQIEDAKDEKQFIENSKQALIPLKDFARLKDLFKQVSKDDADSLKTFHLELRTLFPDKIDEPRLKLSTQAIQRFNPDLKPANAKSLGISARKRKEEQEFIFSEIDKAVMEILNQPQEEEEQEVFFDAMESKNNDDQSNWGQASSNIANQALSSNLNDNDAQQGADQIIAFLNANIPNNDPNNASATLPIGQGKRKRKTKGGAGFEDYLSFFGNIPGGSQALSMIPGFGSVLAPVFDLAQSASKIGSEIGKQVKGSPEKMSGDALSSLSPMKSLLPFSLPFGKGKRKTKGGNISGMFNQVGELTPQLSGVISKAPGAYGTLGALGNSQVGSITRVLGDIFSRFGLGKKPKRNVKGCGAVSMQGQNFPLSDYNQDLTTKGIVNNRLAKARGQMAEVQKFNRSLNQKANVDQQNAVNQLFYTKLMYDVNKIQEEQKAERIKKRRVVKKN